MYQNCLDVYSRRPGVVPVMPVVFAEGARHGRAGFSGWPSRFIKLQTNSNAPIRWPVVSHTLLVCMNRWPSKLTRANGTSPISLAATEGKTKTTVHKFLRSVLIRDLPDQIKVIPGFKLPFL